MHCRCASLNAMKTATVVFLLAVVAVAQLQSLPHDTPETLRARADRMEKWLNDWPNVARYAGANAQLPAPKPGEQRVVFLGDSITDGWKLDQDFPGKPYVNRGISGQTTPQMLVRMFPDVIRLKPAAVIL